MSKIDRQAVFAKYDGHCAYCGVILSSISFQVDHISPKAFKGQDDYDNLNPSCRHCNNYKGAWTVEEFRSFLSRLLNKRTGLFKSHSKMMVAFNFGVIDIIQNWDGKFYFERENDEQD